LKNALPSCFLKLPPSANYFEMARSYYSFCNFLGGLDVLWWDGKRGASRLIGGVVVVDEIHCKVDDNDNDNGIAMCNKICDGIEMA
jgi:hypothetical protein